MNEDLTPQICDWLIQKMAELGFTFTPDKSPLRRTFLLADLLKKHESFVGEIDNPVTRHVRDCALRDFLEDALRQGEVIRL